MPLLNLSFYSEWEDIWRDPRKEILRTWRVCSNLSNEPYSGFWDNHRYVSSWRPYSGFAGRDASRGLATFSVEPVSSEHEMIFWATHINSSKFMTWVLVGKWRVWWLEWPEAQWDGAGQGVGASVQVLTSSNYTPVDQIPVTYSIYHTQANHTSANLTPLQLFINCCSTFLFHDQNFVMTILHSVRNMSLWGGSWSLVKRSIMFNHFFSWCMIWAISYLSFGLYISLPEFVLFIHSANISGAQLQWWRVWWGGGSSCRRREENPVKKFPWREQRKPVKIVLSSVRKSTVFLKCYPSDLDAKIYGNSPAMYCICNRQSMSFSRACRNTSNIVHSLIIWWSHRLGLSEVYTIVSWAWDKFSYISFYT